MGLWSMLCPQPDNWTVEKVGRSHLIGTLLWPWQPLPSFQQLSESQYCHLPLGGAYELDEFLQKKQGKSSTGRAA